MKYYSRWLLAVSCVLICGTVTGGNAGESREVCRAVQRFAVDVAERMRSGVSADQEFDSHGGLDALSKPVLNIINYVHSHRVNRDVQPLRIGALTLAKCENGSFGGLSYADLPESYDPGYQGEDEEGETAGNAVSPAIPPGLRQDSGQNLNGSPDSAPDPRCELYRQQIKDIDDRMRRGYTSEAGDSIREERRHYRELINKHCS